jgi:Tripartite tricarboxylate transporter family receptor
VETYPVKRVRLVVGFAAGATTDIVARLIGQRLSERLGQQFVVENRTGASGNIAVEAVMRAPADGYSLLVTDASPAINAALYDKLNFSHPSPVSFAHSRAIRHGGQSIASCHDGSRVRRLREGQSRERQHGLGRHRKRYPVRSKN